MIENCQLCLPSSGKLSTGFSTLFDPNASVTEVLAATQDFLVILDVAPVVAGHVLIISRTHERSFANLWGSTPALLHEIENAVKEILLDVTGQSAVVCEHGLGLEAKGHAGCVEHAHLQVIPTNAPIVSSFAQVGIDFHEAHNFAKIINCAPQQQYLYLQDIDGRYYIAVHDRFPSQLVRRLVAQRSGEIFWSWRDYVDFADKIGTRERLKEGSRIYSHLKEHPTFNSATQ